MSVSRWIEDLIHSDMDFSSIRMCELQDLVSRLYDLLKKISCGSSSAEKRLRAYKSVVASDLLQSRKSEYPEEFYHFQDDFVNIEVNKCFGKFYSVVFRGFDVSKKKFDIFFASDEFLFDDIEIVSVPFSPEYRSGFSFFGRFDYLAQAVRLWKCIVKYYCLVVLVDCHKVKVAENV